MKVNQGSSLAALVRLGTKKGYELVSVTNLNAIFVRKEYFPAFGIADNSPEALFTDRSCQTSLFSLYDGTIMIAGRDWVGWHGVPISRRRIQMVPRIFRVFPSVMSLPRLLAFRIWRKVRTLGKPAAGSRPNSL